MSKIWKFGLRWISLLGVAGILLIANGCGDDDDDDDRDTTPDAFVIAPQSGVALNAEVTSAPVTVTGIDDPTPISVTNGSYSIGTGPFVTTAGTVINNQTVRVRHTASAANNTPTTSILNIGGVTAPFTSYTLPTAGQDINPATFTFTPLTGAALSRSLTSNAVTVSGITAPAPIFITGGTYSINGGTFTSDPGVILNGQTVAVRTNSSTTNNSVATATLTIGDQNVPFTVTTQQAGGTTTTPAAFTFTNMTSAALNTTVTSSPITVSGITAASAPISVSGGTYSINNGAFTSAAGTVANNATVRVQHTSAATGGADVATVLNIGGVTGTFRSTTELPTAADTTPNAFTFTPQTNVALGATATSNEITVSGINAPTAISVTGGSYSIDGGTYTTAPLTVNNGQTVTVRHTAATTNSATTTTRLTIGGVSGDFTSTTVAAAGSDTIPDTFTFAPQSNVAPNTVITSAPITVTGINAAAPITITGGTYSINGGAYTAAAGNVSNGQSVTVRHTSSAANGTPTNTTLNIGGVTATFTSTTQAAAIDAAALYQARCAGCHRLGTIDTTGGSPNLSNVTLAQMQARFPTPTTSHFGQTLTAAEVAALTTYFQSN